METIICLLTVISKTMFFIYITPTEYKKQENPQHKNETEWS